MDRSIRSGLALLATILLVAASAANGADYPTKPVRIIVPAPAGGGDDFTARVLAEQLSLQLRQQFVVENRPGAGGVIGQMSVAKSPPDGYTLLLAGASMAGARFVNANAKYDLKTDFTPIATIESSPFALIVSRTVQVTSLREFVEHAREQRGRLSYATLGAGQIPYWGTLLLNHLAKIDAVEITYKSIGDAVSDITSGRTAYSVLPLVTAMAVKDRVHILGVTSAERAKSYPEVPTIAEAGLPGYEMPVWRSIMGPAGVSPAVVAILNKEIQRSLASPQLLERYSKAGSTPLGGTPEDLRRRYDEATTIFERMARELQLTPR